MKTTLSYILDNSTNEFIEKLSASNPPPIYTLKPEEARIVLENLQTGPIKNFDVSVEDITIQLTNNRKMSLRIIRPSSKKNQKLPFMMFFHGAGWVMGSKKTHERLTHELVSGVEAALVFVDYSLSPEAQFPLPIEEAYEATQYVVEHADSLNLNAEKVAVVGDSVGGNMAIAVTMLAKERKKFKIDCQVLFYPVTSSECNTQSYEQYAEGPWLTRKAMEWFWNAYAPNLTMRRHPLISPLNAFIDDLNDLPQALIITAENDVLRDEGEAYAHKLMQAGVEVTAFRALGAIHDFVMLNGLSETPPCRLAMQTAISFLKKRI